MTDTFARLYVDQSAWGQIAMTGADRVRFLQGMCSANIETLAAGAWVRAVVCNVKGRVVSVVDVVRRDDSLLLACEPELADKTIATLRKFAIMDEVELERVDGPLHRVWDAPDTVWDAPPVFAPPPAPAASASDVEVRRIEAGLPRYGVDVTEDQFPFESRLREALDYHKGCYIGQEPIARVHAQGAANKSLLGLVVDGPDPVSPGAAVSHPDRDPAGAVTSSAVSPVFGSIALAYVHKSVWEPGTRVTVDGRDATVTAVPMRRD